MELKKVTIDPSLLNTNYEVVLANYQGKDLFHEETLQKVSYYSDKKYGTKSFQKKILTVGTKELNYVATNFAADAVSYQSCSKYYVGFLNRRTNKIRVVNTSMYNLRPTTLGYPYEIQKSLDGENKKGASLREELTKSFGSSKKQRALEARTKHHVTSEDVLGLMHKVIEDVDVTEPIKLESMITTSDDSLPPINRDAKKIEDVYEMNKIIIIQEENYEEWEQASAVFLNATTDEIRNWDKNHLYPHFVLSLLSKLPCQLEIRAENCKQLMYMNYLWQLLQLQHKQLKSRDYLPDVPTTIKETLMAKFFQISCQANRAGPVYKTMTVKQKDCLLAYIIVLVLLYNNYSFCASELMPDLKISQVKFNTLVRAVGASVKRIVDKGSKMDVVTLSLPLTVLEIKRGRKMK